MAAAYLWDVDDLSGFVVTQKCTNGRVNWADRCTHTSDEYDTSPSIWNHNLCSFASGEVGPMDVDIKEFLSTVEGVSVIARLSTPR